MGKANIDKRGRSIDTTGGHVRIHRAMWKTNAWKDLPPGSRIVYLAIKFRFRGAPNSKNNNGRIPMSRDEMAADTGLGASSMREHIPRLINHGFIKISKKGHFNLKSGERRATEYIITEFALKDERPTRDYLQWHPKKNTRVRKLHPVPESRVQKLHP